MGMTTVTPVEVVIATRVDHLAQDFLSLATALETNTRFAAQVSPAQILDEFSRFKLWAGNIAAHRKGRRSLEYRLRDAIHLKSETHGQLDALSDSLQDALSIVMCERLPWDELSASDTESDMSDDEGSDTGFHGDTELIQILAGIKTVITSLFRLSMAIRNPAPNSQSTSNISIDKSFYEQHDIQHVAEKFRDAPHYLIERLGRASSARRQYLSYREEHHQKLTKDIEKLGFEKATTEFTTNSTEATRIERMSSLDVLDEGDDVASQTSYATSSKAAIRVPTWPKAARGKDFFECPLCFLLISIHTAAEWKQHVFRDLHPYCCTYQDCNIADRLYDSRKAWFAHELEAHRVDWQCIDECGCTFETEAGFESHIQKDHQELASPRMLSALKRTSTQKATLSVRTECVLCGQRMALRALEKHVGRHQQQLALFALPANMEDEDEEQYDHEDDQEDNDSGPTSKGAAEDSDADISDASESEQDDAALGGVIDGSLAPTDRCSHSSRPDTEFHLKFALRDFLVPDAKVWKHDMMPVNSTKFGETVREKSTEGAGPSEESTITFDLPHSSPHEDSEEPHIVTLESNLDKLEDAVASSKSENVELAQQLEAHKESVARARLDYERDHIAQEYHDERLSNVVREIGFATRKKFAEGIGHPEEERRDRGTSLAPMSRSRTPSIIRYATDREQKIQADDLTGESQLFNVIKHDETKQSDDGRISNEGFPNDRRSEISESDLSHQSDGKLLLPQSQPFPIIFSDAAMDVPKANDNEVPPPLPPPRHLVEKRGQGWQWGVQDDVVADDHRQQANEQQVDDILASPLRSEPAVKSSDASNVSPKLSAETAESTHVLPMSSDPTSPSSLGAKKEARVRYSKGTAAIPRDGL